MNPDLNTRPVPLGLGQVWTLDAQGRKVLLEQAALRTVGSADGQCSAAAEVITPDPVILECSISPPGVPAVRVELQLTIGEWATLREATGGRGVLSLLLAPSVMARFRPQAWVDDQALDVDGGGEEFEALHGIFETYPSVSEFVEQIQRREWDDLASYSTTAGQHSGPYEVDLDPDLVLVLAALYKGDGPLLSDLLAGVPSAAARVAQDDWERARVMVAALSPPPPVVEHLNDTVESLFLEALAAFEGEEDSVRAEHRRLIARMQAVVRRMPGQDRTDNSSDERAASRPRQR